jgi:hypothetical protein
MSSDDEIGKCGVEGIYPLGARFLLFFDSTRKGYLPIECKCMCVWADESRLSLNWLEDDDNMIGK